MQLESMDKQLENGLWSVFYEMVAQPGRQSGTTFIYQHSQYYGLLTNLWKRFYKLPIDTFFRYDRYESHSRSL